MSVYPRNHKDSKILVFVEDFASYHLELIRSGIQDYFDRAERTLSYVQLDITELTRFFGTRIEDQIAAIGILRSNELTDYLEEKNIPFLNLCGHVHRSKWGFDIRFDGIGSMAADYFISDLGVEHLGFIGRFEEAGHEQRFREFKDRARSEKVSLSTCYFEKRGRTPTLYSYLTNIDLRKEDPVRDFLINLKKPAGVFCADDRIAFSCYFNCEALGISVPNEVAILGVGSRSPDKSSWAETVSVVEIDHYRLGLLGAKLIDEYCATGKLPSPVHLKPSGIQHNQTTVQKRVADPLVQKVLAIVSDEPHINVEEIAKRLKVNRKSLDKRFYRLTHTTISKTIEQERFKRAKKLLRNHKYSVESIAGLAGYPNRKSMRRSFQRFTKMSPHKFKEWEKSRFLEE